MQVGLNPISVSTDGLTLPFLLDLATKQSPLVPIMDYVHHIKIALGPLRRLDSLSVGDISLSLKIITDEMGKGNFSHLKFSEHISPEDDQAVEPCLELIGKTTRDSLHALRRRNASLLADYFALLERYFLAFDIKRTRPDEHNPHDRPVLSMHARLVELDEIVPLLIKAS